MASSSDLPVGNIKGAPPRSSSNVPPLLSICIPTFNRAGHLEKLLWSLENITRCEDVEVIVVNNASTDGTREIGALFPSVAFIHREVHLETAEENIIRALRYCNGDYIWFLGDDDIPCQFTLAQIRELLSKRSYDYLLFNMASISSSGTQLIQSSAYNIAADLIEFVGLREMIMMFGVTMILAGVSNHIMLREALSEEDGLKWLGIAPIYSHVGWFASAFRSRKAAFFNRPLVFYRLNDYSNGHWQHYAKRKNIGDHAIWWKGLPSLLDEMVRRECITRQEIGRIVETREDRTQYRLVENIIYMLFRQIDTFRRTKTQRQAIGDDEFRSVRIFLLRADPTVYDLIVLLDQFRRNAKERTGKRCVTLFNRRFAEWRRMTWRTFRFMGTYRGYELHQTPLFVIGVRTGDSWGPDTLPDALDPDSIRRGVVWGESDCAVRKRIDEGLDCGAGTDGYKGDLGWMEEKIEEQRRIIEVIQNSRSWRITAPLRYLRRVIWRFGPGA